MISLPDAYAELVLLEETLPGYLPRPGRLNEAVLEENDEFLQFLRVTHDELPLDTKSIKRVIAACKRFLLQVGSCTPRPSKKPELVPRKLLSSNLQAFLSQHSTFWGQYAQLAAGLQGFFGSFGLDNLLYKKYRCAAVHEARILLDPKAFFQDDCPTFSSLDAAYPYLPPGIGKTVLFPAKFLLQTVENSIQAVEERFVRTKQLPILAWRDICYRDELRYVET